ncbi:hypothetical protein [Pontibacter burrus]|uniref:Tetratricopeptide repeat protein n=1 Tax=Pontibacter burrus TaxID=2704466 RepID=A0A6B3LTA4_9BACT|nr:hypothetical protein [Pontibacter burrus]NEM96807.1 hypothetical protein [Pontibacter burrus]
MIRAILSVFLLFAAVAVQAQTKLIFEETTPEAYLMKYSTTGGSSQTYLNTLINLLKEGDVKKNGGRPSARTPEFVVRMEQQARIADAGDKLQLKVQLSKISVNSDVSYKGFGVEDVLLPEMLNVKVKLLDGKKKELQTFNLTNIPFKKEGFTLLDVTIPDTTKTAPNYSLVVEAKGLNYTAASVSKFRNYLGLIGDYYAADATITRALQDINLIQPEDVDRISQHNHNLRQMEDMYKRLKEQNYKEKLNLRLYDPQRLDQKMTDLNRLMQERRRAVDYALSTMDLQFFNKGMSLVANGNTNAARSYFEKSLGVNAKFAPSHLQLARLDFINGYLNEATARILDVLTRMRIDPETRQMLQVLAHDIYGAHMSQGHNLTNRGDYNAALHAFGSARELCKTVSGLGCNMPALRDGEGRAANGIYRNIIAEGKRELTRNNIAQADRLAEEALRFQSDYRDVLPQPTEAIELQNQVKYTYYVEHIDKGKSYLNSKNYGAALSQFDAALDLEAAYSFREIPELDALAKRAAKPVLLAELQTGYEQAMRNQLVDARALASKAIAMQGRYGLDKDAEVISKYNLLRDRIVTQECQNAQYAYDEHVQNAKQLARNKQYLAADKAYLSALGVASDNTICQLADFTAKDGREAILPAVRYQQMLEDVNRFVASGRYTEALQTYNQAEKHYKAYEVNRFGLNHISLYNYAHETTKLPFTAEVVQYYASLGEEEVAISLLTILLQKDYKNRKTKSVQEQLGKQLAAQDVQLGLKDAASALAMKHTNNNRDLKKLRKAYEKERKRLAKAKV